MLDIKDKDLLIPKYKEECIHSSTEEEMKNWLRDRGNRDLVADLSVSRGWEDSTVMVVDIQPDSVGVENLCVRA